MSKLAAIVLTFLAISFPSLAQDAKATKSQALQQAVEQCVRENAASVESTIADLSQATDFLVQKICAVPVSAQNAFQMAQAQEQQKAKWRKMCDEQKSKHPASTATSAKDNSGPSYVCSVATLYAPDTDDEGDGGTYAYAISIGSSGEPATTALAAKLLLDFRLSHASHTK